MYAEETKRKGRHLRRKENLGVNWEQQRCNKMEDINEALDNVEIDKGYDMSTLTTLIAMKIEKSVNDVT